MQDEFQEFSFLLRDNVAQKVLVPSQLVLDEEKRLISTVIELEQLINFGLMKMEELRTIQQVITKYQMGGNVNAEFQLKRTVAQKIETPYGQWVTNCTKCRIT